MSASARVTVNVYNSKSEIVRTREISVRFLNKGARWPKSPVLMHWQGSTVFATKVTDAVSAHESKLPETLYVASGFPWRGDASKEFSDAHAAIVQALYRLRFMKRSEYLRYANVRATRELRERTENKRKISLQALDNLLNSGDVPFQELHAAFERFAKMRNQFSNANNFLREHAAKST